MKVYDSKTGKSLGSGSATITDKTQLNYKSRTWKHTVGFRVTRASGLAVAGAVVVKLANCGHGCHAKGSTGPKAYVVRKTVNFSFTLNSPGTKKLYHREDTLVSFSCAACKGRFSVPTLQATNPAVRCDSTPDLRLRLQRRGTDLQAHADRQGRAVGAADLRGSARCGERPLRLAGARPDAPPDQGQELAQREP
ncbi:hypothetical protein GCM10029978_081850 [Actinoallomurus acanthiterrae]